jgi:hypothetical protein
VNPLGRRTRRDDDWASPHERARTRAAQWLDWPLDPAEAAWLEAHLTDCRSCRRRADEYLENRDRLRKLRDTAPPPPRDLWARTAAAIELESQRRRRTPTRGLPLGALSGIVVIVVVLGATLLSNTPTPTIAPSTEAAPEIAASATASLLPGPVGTPFLVAAGDVGVVQRGSDGGFGFGRLGVDSVCPEKQDMDCPMVPDPSATALGLDTDPQTIIGSPNDQQAIAVSKPDESNASEVIVIALPKASDAPQTTVSETEPPVTQEPTATADVSEPPAASEPPTTSSAAPETPQASDVPLESTPASEPPAESAEPSDEPTTPSPQESDPVTPTPTPESIAIASNLIVIGQTAAYSPDGNWFAFTARPADESHGPDIYLWHVGSERAEPITEDHNSVFASWTDGRIVGSRPLVGGDTSVEPLDLPVAEVFLLDPESGEEEVLAEAGFRPIVSPDGRLAIVFSGPVEVGEEGQDLTLGKGTLELRNWSAAGALAEGATPVIDSVDTPFDARWDESGTAFAVWVQDAADPSFGRLSLFFIDPDGEILQPENAPQEEPALPGFSIGDGRLAWATPAGQGGEGSRVQIVAWTDEGVGTAETAPGDQVVVIR